jgi:hypothetical protein
MRTLARMIYYDCENIPFKAPRLDIVMEKEKVSMRLFRRKSRAVKNWHARALTIDLTKTKLTIVRKKTPKQVPAWVYKKYAPQYLPQN